MTYGYCRVTVLDAEGRPYVADVKVTLGTFLQALPIRSASVRTVANS
jgi:hypothetical protein